MKVIDLTHLLNNETTVYPGSGKPVFEQTNTVEKNGYAEQKITMYTHTGTHIDAPAHMLKDGKPLDELAPESFFGKAVCIDCTGVKGGFIEIENLKTVEEKIQVADFVLLRTDWSKKWKDESYFTGFPVLSENACKWLTKFGLKGIGLDVISIDPVNDSYEMINHQIVLKKGMLIIENLTNLHLLTTDIFLFSCLPLKIENADGSPVRAVAIYE